MAFTSDYKFRGKHATYVKYLSKDKGQLRVEGVNIFNRIIDVYMLAPIIGLFYNKRSLLDYESNDTSNIPYATIERERNSLDYIYRLIIMCDVNCDMDDAKRVEQAFKYDSDTEMTRINDEIFNGYVLGGVEYLYELFKLDLDDENASYEHILELINNFSEDEYL